MFDLEQIYAEIPRYLPLIVTATVVLVTLRLIQWLWLGRKFDAFSDRKIIPQALMLLFSVVGGVFIVLALPVSDTLRAQILSLLGLVMTGVMALSSATFVSNAFAGSMLRLTRSFRVGDYIRIGSQGGRVTERGIFHTEIQTEDRDLTTFPNLLLVTNAVTVVRSSGTIVTATISLGYDLPHSRVEELLIEAAKQVELEDPYVHVVELGDFSVSYKVCGFLSDIKVMLTTRSRLKKSILDTLHGANIEIVSPTFMNQRPQKEGVVFIPKPSRQVDPTPSVDLKTAEEIAFDKADDAEAEALKNGETIDEDEDDLKSVEDAK
ncbi:mechanosensitive ion channel family protein [Coraliomargarita sp. SDUM461003]|uniref:Mechanosensitive ion channel family protein n=1 Tax=Thalassobacterium maritimum TaxID=3041265 RepID=A0ABU1AYT8_9BACT|nr:mechanosensitive ion channel family protein [Coraliomargarita sp. SDUM461003]MDQ8209325.1 mechanosensitive ion channel family protein [Coraliomargarita sp. SDUM461003]